VDDRPVRTARVRHAAAALRRSKLGAACLALALAAAPSASAQRQWLGRSATGRPIVLIRTGDPNGVPVLVVGCIHGTESAGIAVANRLARESPAGIDLWIVPVLNPDGLARHTRGNAHGVDLNRNFPFRWRRFGGVYYSGPHALSEVEARLAYRLILRVHPLVSVWFHQHLDLVWASGGNLRVEQRFAQVSGLRYARLPPLAGSAIDWQNHALPGTTAFAAELPAGTASRAAVGRYSRAVIASARVASRRMRALRQTSPQAPSSARPSRP
jgi:protein MpaA